MKKDNFLRGAFIATLCLIITKILGILYVIPFYSVIGSYGSVLYGCSYNIYAVFLNISTVGIPLAISKLVSEYNTLEYHDLKRRTYKVAAKIMTITAITSTVILFLFSPFLAKLIMAPTDYTQISNALGSTLCGYTNYKVQLMTINDISFVIKISSSAIFFVTIISMIRGYLQGMKYIQASSIAQVIEQLVRVLVIIIGSYLCIKVFNTKVSVAVGVAIFGATLGAIVSYVYLIIKKRQIKEDPNYEIKSIEKNITDKSLFKKIIHYTIPFVIMGIIGTSFELVDMFTVVRTLTTTAHFSSSDASVIMNIVTTLGSKLNVIVVAVANGIVVSLLPNLTSDYVKGNLKGVCNKINRTLQIIMCITLPMTVGLSLLAKPVWNIFYGDSFYGPKVFMVSVFVAIFNSLFTNIMVTLQSLSRYKALYISLFSGFLFNAIMNIPFMKLFYAIGLPIYYGNLVATMIGYAICLGIGLYELKRFLHINYSETIKSIMISIIATIVMSIIILMINMIIPISSSGSRINSIFITLFYAIIGFIIYFAIIYKTGVFKRVIGIELSRIKKKERN